MGLAMCEKVTLFGFGLEGQDYQYFKSRKSPATDHSFKDEHAFLNFIAGSRLRVCAAKRSRLCSDKEILKAVPN